MLKISVIIPNYNHALYLNQRIDSVLNQTYQDFEVIILDDCSPDNSKEVIEQYRGHPKVTSIVYNELNSGSTFKQWEKGLGIATGEYIWIAESDDWCEPYFLETLMNNLKKGDVLAYAQSYVINNEFAIIGFTPNIVDIKPYEHLTEYLNGDSFIRKYMTVNNAIANASMAVFKKSAFFAISKEFTDFKYCGDWLFWIEIARQGNVFISAKYLNFFRKHDKDVSSKAHASGLIHLESIRLTDILRRDSLITEKEFKSLKYAKYVAYRQMKYKFPDQIQKNVEDHFYKYNDKNLFERPFKLKYPISFLKLAIKKLLVSFIK